MTKIKNGTILTYIDTDLKKQKVIFAEIPLRTYLQNLLEKMKFENKFKVEPIREGRLTKSLSQALKDVKKGDIVVYNDTKIKIKSLKQNLFLRVSLNFMQWLLK